MPAVVPAPELVLVGGGHANIAVLKAAGRWTARGVRVTLVTDQRFLYYSGMTPEHVRGLYPSGALSIDLLRWCLTNRVQYVESAATRVDLEARCIRTLAGDVLPYDLATFDVGGVPAADGQAGDAVRVKPLTHIERLIAWLDAAPGGTLVVVGGGAAGTELMLNISARTRRSRPLRLVLLEPGDRLLGPFAPALGQRALGRLRARGVEVRFGQRVKQVQAGGLDLETGEHLPSDLTVWATGTHGHPLFGRSGLPVDDRDFVQVGRTLQVRGHPALLAAGDCTVVEGLHLDRSGVNAVAQGLALRRGVEALLSGGQAGRLPAEVVLPPFRPYGVSPYLLSTGDHDALLALGPHFWARGRPLLALKHLADRIWIGRYHWGSPGT